jgi:Fuc2NAc and GlcNAc transferase
MVNISQHISIVPFCVTVAIFLSVISCAIVAKFGHRVALIDRPNERSSHLIPTPMGGGIGIWIAFIVVGIFFTRYSILTIMAGIVGLIGLIEDRFSLSSKLRMLLHLSISSVTVILFLGFPLSVIELLLIFFWTVFITGTANFYNFMDGINGIAGLTGFVGFGLMAIFAQFIINDPDIVLMSLVLSAGCLGFLPFNFPKARVFMGDVGSVLLGFLFASFVVKLSTDISLFLCLIMFLCTFYADALVTIFYRWRKGENLLKAHRGHLYQYMSNEMAMPHWKVATIYAIMQLIFGFLALLAYRQGFMWQLTVSGGFAVMFFVTYKIIKNIIPLTATARTDI